MATILLYIGIALIVIGWLTLSWFAAKQLKAQNQYGKLPQKMGGSQAWICNQTLDMPRPDYFRINSYNYFHNTLAMP